VEPWNTTGYHTGYIQKRQPVGRFALAQATQNLKSLAQSIQHRSNTQQYHHVANRMLGDLEYRGHVRPGTEETNLAANHDENDVSKAEFIRTFYTAPFYGGQLLQRLRKLLHPDAEGEQPTKAVYRVRVALPGCRRADTVNVNFDDSYGYRGDDPRVYFLNPWEWNWGNSSV